MALGTRGAFHTTLALYVRLEAKPGKEHEVEALLKDVRSLVLEERDTVGWFALRLGPSTFAIFDAFSGESGREAHLKGRVAAKLTEMAPNCSPTRWNSSGSK